MAFRPHLADLDAADIVYALGEVRGQLSALTESVVSLRGRVDALGQDLDARLTDMDRRVRAVERESFLVTRVGGFLAAGILALLGWLASGVL